MNPNAFPSMTITCAEAAAGLRKNAGMAIHAPRLGQLFRTFDKCNGFNCPGHSRVAVVLEIGTRAREDMILALLN